MKIAIIGKDASAPWYIKQWKIAAKTLGVKIALVNMKDVVLKIDQKKGVRAQFWVYDREEKKIKVKDFKDYDILIRRWVSKYYVQSLVLGWYMKKLGKVVLNSKLEMILDKVSQAIRLYEAGLPHPLTWQALRPCNAKKLLSQVKKFPVIIKPISSSMGRGIFKAKSHSGALKIVSKKDLHDLLIQRDLDMKYDIRIFVVGGKCLGGMKRIAPEGDFRSNVAVGATTEKYDLTSGLKDLALRAAKAMNYEICGVDVMFRDKKPYILEVNRTPQFKGFSRTFEINVAEEILKFAISRHKHNGLTKIFASKKKEIKFTQKEFENEAKEVKAIEEKEKKEPEFIKKEIGVSKIISKPAPKFEKHQIDEIKKDKSKIKSILKSPEPKPNFKKTKIASVSSPAEKKNQTPSDHK
jgi:ribosomal protein S6--L-glutamate ligase